MNLCRYVVILINEKIFFLLGIRLLDGTLGFRDDIRSSDDVFLIEAVELGLFNQFV